MDNNNKKQLSPRWVGAIFFAIFGFFFLLLSKYILLSLKQSAVLPFFPALLTALMLGSLLGYVFGKPLANQRRWFYSFLTGVAMALIALLFLSLGVVIETYSYKAPIIQHFNQWQDYFVFYGATFLSFLFIIGIWLMLFTGLAAVYFNKRFWPTFLAIDKLRLQSPNKR